MTNYLAKAEEYIGQTKLDDTEFYRGLTKGIRGFAEFLDQEKPQEKIEKVDLVTAAANSSDLWQTLAINFTTLESKINELIDRENK